MELANLHILLIVGCAVLVSFYVGKSTKFIKLPSIIGYMLLGVVLGPSVFDILTENIQHNLGFITEIALGFVALSIGLELKFSVLKNLGKGIIYIIFLESFAAFALVTACVYALTKNMPMALIFGSIAPASAPAGTVAVIQEYKAKGSLTKALYAIVGFDDGLGIIIFGFASAISLSLLKAGAGVEQTSMATMMLEPLKEVGLSLGIGIVLALLFSALISKVKNKNEINILLFALVLIIAGISNMLHLSLILTNMIVGMFIVNTQKHTTVSSIHDKLPIFMPLLFILFFTLAGSNLHLSAIPSLGILGIVYVIARSTGLIGGAALGGIFGHVEKKIKRWVGLGILSQAGVAIGLSLIVKQDFSGIGKVVSSAGGKIVTAGDEIGATVITTITATCIFFEIIGPVLTKIALTKAKEINKH